MTDYYGTYKSREEVIAAWQRGELFITGFISERGDEVIADKVLAEITYTFDNVAELKVNYDCGEENEN